MAQSEKIIISVELRDKGVTTGSKKAKKAVDDLTDSAKRLAKAEKELAFQESKEGKELAALTIKKQLAVQANKNLAIATMKSTDATMKGKTQTGLNNAILTEAGRAASDAAYGMQGMANNLGQLLTLMSQHVETKGGFVASMKSLGTSLLGTGGILIGLQLFIAYLPQIAKAFETAEDRAKKFREELKKLKDEVHALETVQLDYVDALLTYSTSSEERARITEELIRLTPTLKKEDFDYGNNLAEVVKKIEAYTLAQANRIEIDKLTSDNSRILAETNVVEEIKAMEDGAEKLSRIRDLLQREGIKITETQTSKVVSTVGGIATTMTREVKKNGKELMNDFEKVYSKILNESSPILKRIRELTSGLLPTLDEEGAGEAEKVFKEKLLDYITEIKQARKVAETQDVLSARETLDAKQKLRRQELAGELLLFEKKEHLRLEEFKARKGVTKKQISNAQATYDNEIKLAEKSYTEALVFIGLAEDAENNVFNNKEDIKEAAFNKDMERLQRRIDTTKALVDSEGDEIKGLILPNTREQLEEDAANIQTQIAQKDLLLSKEIEDNDVRRDLSIERTNLELELAKKRMNIAQIEEDAKRDNIKNIIGLLGSASKVAKKGSVASKALSIASTTVSTWTTAQAAAEAQTKAGGATAPVRAAIAYAAALAKGALTVKNIVAEKKPSGGSSGGGGGMPSVQPADFNIIGSTGTNQLADAIGGTTQQPIKAYVVSSEVTSAQELDRNIVESASI